MEHSKKLGTFYGVGVGPGDPELLTLKAVRVLEACPVLAAPQTASGEMTALSIARQAADLEGKTLLPLYFTMSRDRAKQQEAHINAVDERKQMLRMRAGWLSNQIMFFVRTKHTLEADGIEKWEQLYCQLLSHLAADLPYCSEQEQNTALFWLLVPRDQEKRRLFTV